jgi:parallel beta-helix repeat protein
VRRVILLAAAFLVVTVVPLAARTTPAAPDKAAGGGAPKAGTSVCGTAILDSPWNYSGAAGSYTSGTAGLPTFGSAGTDFPAATAGLVVAAGNNTAAAGAGTYQLNNTVVYFEPGTHTIQGGMFAGHNSAYVGGYTLTAGKAVIDGVNGADSGSGGNHLTIETPSANDTVNNTWEYLTVQNFSADVNSAIMGLDSGPAGISDGDTYKYMTVGPNEYAYHGASAPLLNTTASPGQGGGYGIFMGNYTTIEYSCLTQDAQGGYAGSSVAGDVIASNEISSNGLGIYPDNAPATGASPHNCGCSGGGKMFYSVNADIVNNYVHDNYNVGIWMDFDNTGTLISHNYVSSNWSAGIMVEASYNTNISGNTLTGNGWASDGAWPAGVGGGTCFGGVSCTLGDGPVTGAGGGNPFGDIYLPNTGGDSQLASIPVPNTVQVPGCASSCTVTSRYTGHVYVTGNKIVNSFGGVQVYSSTDRFAGSNNSADSGCSDILGVLNQMNNNATYYTQTKVLITASDTAISGTSVTSAGGTAAQCSNYGATSGAGGNYTSTVTAPSAGMGVFDQAKGTFLGNVQTVTSANAFTLDRSPGASYAAGDALELSAYGGCGPADYYQGGLGTTSGTPPAAYWDHCIWGSRNVTVSGNQFSINSGTVTGCTTGANLCGYQQAVAFDAGVPLFQEFWFPYTSYIMLAVGGLGNVFSSNAYTWTGSGAWLFNAGTGTLNTVPRSTWQNAYGQDAGSTFG